MTKTVAGEADGDPSAPAVAHVILNRLNSGNFGGNTVPQVVLANKPSWQFTTWRDQGRDLSNLTPSDPKYQRAVKVVNDVVSGAIPDPTGGALYYDNPKLQASGYAGQPPLPPPSFAKGPGQQIGQHVFYGGNPTLAVASNGDISGSVNFVKGLNLPPPPGAQPAAAQGFNSSDFVKSLKLPPPASSAAPGASASPAPTAAPPPAAAAPPQQSAPDTSTSQGFISSLKIPAPVTGNIDPTTGLIETPQGGRDPQTGTLIRAGKPFSTLPTSPVVAAGGNALNAVPFVGPQLLGGVQSAAAGASSLARGASYDQTLSAMQGITDASSTAYPKTSALGALGGTALGLAPAVEMAPAAFGIGNAPWLARYATSALIGAGLSGGDAAWRAYMAGQSPTGIASSAALPAAFGLVGGARGQRSGTRSR